MIREVEGDILLTEAAAIAHGVAPFDHFDSGLALALRERLPAMVKDFRHYCHTQHVEPGGLWIWSGVDFPRVINLFTQTPAPKHGPGHGGKASVTSVGHCLRELKKLIASEGLTSVALPKLATGVGGLEWRDVRPLIDHHLGSLDCSVILYSTYRADQKANEHLG